MPKERHVLKECYGCTLGLCIGCNKRHDSTFGQSTDPKDIQYMSIQTGCFQYTHKINSKLGYDPKERHAYTLVKRLDAKESHGS